MLRVDTVWAGLTGLPGYTQIYFDNPGDDAIAVKSFVGALWSDTQAKRAAALVATVQQDVYQIAPTDGHVIGVLPGGSSSVIPGTNANQKMPNLVQGLLRLNTGVYVNGRKQQGHLYLPGATEDANTIDGIVDPAYRTAWSDAWASAKAQVPAANPVVWSRLAGVITPVSTVEVSPQWSYLRSRRD